jgi:hypothetical protein
MSLGLHSDCRKRLEEKIAEQLSQLKVESRMFLEQGSTAALILAESVLPERGKIKDQLVQYIGEFPIHDFVYETLSRELNENEKYDAGAPLLSLTELEDYKDSTSVARDLSQILNPSHGNIH